MIKMRYDVTWEVYRTNEAHNNISTGLKHLNVCSKFLKTLDIDAANVVKIDEALKALELIQANLLDYLSYQLACQTLESGECGSCEDWGSYIKHFGVSSRTVHTVSRNMEHRGIKEFMNLKADDILSWVGAGKVVACEVEDIQKRLLEEGIEEEEYAQNENERNVQH